MIAEESGKLIFHRDGETLMIQPWGKNALRISATLMGDILSRNWALL